MVLVLVYPVVFNATVITDRSKFRYDSTNNKVVIGYTDYGNNYYGTAIVGTVSGTVLVLVLLLYLAIILLKSHEHMT